MDALERIKAFHNEQFEEVEVCAPTFRGAPIRKDFIFPADVDDEQIFKELQTSANDSGWKLTKQNVVSKGGEAVYRVIGCDHSQRYVLVSLRALTRCNRVLLRLPIPHRVSTQEQVDIY